MAFDAISKLRWNFLSFYSLTDHFLHDNNEASTYLREINCALITDNFAHVFNIIKNVACFTISCVLV